jgi:hypothetical protein
MKKAREFDCVRLKDEIQARLMREYKGLTDEQIRRRRARKLATSRSPIAKLWRALQVRDKKQAKAPGVRRAAKRSRRMRSPA